MSSTFVISYHTEESTVIAVTEDKSELTKIMLAHIENDYTQFDIVKDCDTVYDIFDKDEGCIIDDEYFTVKEL